jgi:hypothetical protein
MEKFVTFVEYRYISELIDFLTCNFENSSKNDSCELSLLMRDGRSVYVMLKLIDVIFKNNVNKDQDLINNIYILNFSFLKSQTHGRKIISKMNNYKK